MPVLNPTVALETIERALRQLYTVVFEARYGAGWLHQLVAADKADAWAEKQRVEGARRSTRGVATVSENLLDYAEFSQVIDIANKNWGDVSNALGDRKDTMALLRRFEQLRNTVAHSRPLLPFEEDLLSGIAGEIRNRVTIFMSSQPTANEYWARVESVTDSLGHTVDGVETIRSSNPHCATGKTLHVGDVVTFDCRATDPKGRTIAWSMAFLPNDHSRAQPKPVEGEAVTLSWTVEPHHVSSSTSVQITMRSDSPNHRWSEGRDGFAGFLYQVLPATSLQGRGLAGAVPTSRRKAGLTTRAALGAHPTPEVLIFRGDLHCRESIVLSAFGPPSG